MIRNAETRSFASCSFSAISASRRFYLSSKCAGIGTLGFSPVLLVFLAVRRRTRKLLHHAPLTYNANFFSFDFQIIPPMSKETEILQRIAAGDEKAADELLPIVYNDLRKLAHRRLSGDRAGASLQTTELVHEAYLRLVGPDQQWEGNAHFFAAAAEAMRRILVERARQKKQIKRGGDLQRVALDDAIPAHGPSAEETLVVDDLLDRFAVDHPVEAQIVKLRYFAGFTTNEAAKLLEIPATTAYRHWTFAKTWIFREMRKAGEVFDGGRVEE